MKTFAALMCSVAFATMLAFASTAPSEVDEQVDRVFAKWNSPSTPGCAVGVAVNGQPVLAKAYGIADLEHDVRNTAETIFEAGSVSKQFTAASVLLLANEGKLSLDDPVRKYIPELPLPPNRFGAAGPPPPTNGFGAAGSVITIRHMLNHTSGLRDWGSIEAIAGWPRTSRVYTHAHVLEIVSRQRALNFTPGTRWSYSNTGYNLAAMIVSRVSGMPFAEFTRRRLFEPLGMMHTSWRDDHTRIVRNRAIAYDEEKDGFHTDMPFEDVHGNGGLLTTVGDLLMWNENFVTPKVGDAAFVQLQQEPGHFVDGRSHGYALGLMLHKEKGVRVVEHSGSTAGYQAHLARYPDQHVSAAVLCNASSARATEYAHSVAELYLADSLKPTTTTPKYTLTAADIERLAGVYRDTSTGLTLTLVRDNNGIRVERDGTLIAMSASRLVTSGGDEFDVVDGRARVTDAFGTVSSYERVERPNPTTDQLKDLVGRYGSDEAETTLTVTIEGNGLVAKRRPDSTLKLTPVYADAFSAPQLGLVIFHRDGAGHVTDLSVAQDRVWDLRFARQPAAAKSVSQ